MTPEEAIYKMLIQALKNQRIGLWAAQREAGNKVWKDDLAYYATETENLLEKVMGDRDTQANPAD